LLYIAGPKREEAAGGLRKLHNEELHNSSLYIRMIKSRGRNGRTCSTHGRDEKLIQIVGWKA